MKFFVDSVDVLEIKKLNTLGLVDGVTTNPSLIAKSGQPLFETIEEISKIVKGPVSAEVTATDCEGMVREGKKLAMLGDNIAIKVPLIEDGIQACKVLTDEGFKVNVTLCFSAAQALIAAKVGANFVSPFIGRLDDIGENGMELIRDIIKIFSNYDFSTAVLVSSVRHPGHVLEAARCGAQIVTVPPSILWKLFKHPLTDQGLSSFLEDWKKTGQTID